MEKVLHEIEWKSYIYKPDSSEMAEALKANPNYFMDADECLKLNYGEQRAVVDISTMNPMHFKFFVVVKPIAVHVSTTLDALEALINKLESLPSIAQTLNTKCDVHIGGTQLMTMNRLCLVKDACTDHLQALLSEGWRILSINVQPDQRRSDYVLGRYEPDCKEVTALRG